MIGRSWHIRRAALPVGRLDHPGMPKPVRRPVLPAVALAALQ